MSIEDCPVCCASPGGEKCLAEDHVWVCRVFDMPVPRTSRRNAYPRDLLRIAGIRRGRYWGTGFALPDGVPPATATRSVTVARSVAAHITRWGTRRGSPSKLHGAELGISTSNPVRPTTSVVVLRSPGRASCGKGHHGGRPVVLGVLIYPRGAGVRSTIDSRTSCQAHRE